MMDAEDPYFLRHNPEKERDPAMNVFTRAGKHLLWTSLSCVSLFASAAAAETNLVTKASRYSVIETIDRIETAVVGKGMHIFARIDHSGEAKKVGLEMKPTMLLIFGNPKGGTPLMVARPTAAIDLPLKALAWEDADGKVWLTYNTADLLHERHGVPKDLAAKLDPVQKVLEQAVE
jgi:uncharacterized protein (DUF302 family)